MVRPMRSSAVRMGIGDSQERIERSRAALQMDDAGVPYATSRWVGGIAASPASPIETTQLGTALMRLAVVRVRGGELASGRGPIVHNS